MTVKELLINTLEAVNKEVYLQGSLAENASYPDSFITFFTLGSPEISHYNNGANSWEWSFQVANYSIDPLTVASEAENIRVSLKTAGFIPQGKGYDLLSDEPTHTGWVNEYKYIEYESEE